MKFTKLGEKIVGWIHAYKILVPFGPISLCWVGWGNPFRVSALEYPVQRISDHFEWDQFLCCTCTLTYHLDLFTNILELIFFHSLPLINQLWFGRKTALPFKIFVPGIRSMLIAFYHKSEACAFKYFLYGHLAIWALLGFFFRMLFWEENIFAVGFALHVLVSYPLFLDWYILVFIYLIFIYLYLFVVLPFQKELCVWPGMGQLCLRKNLLYGFMRLFSMPFKTLRSVSRTVGGVSNFCSITNMSNTLQIELVSIILRFDIDQGAE